MATISAAISSGKRPSMASMGRKLYVVDGWRRMKVWDGFTSSSRDAGLEGPPSGATGWDPTLSATYSNLLVADGVHLVRYRYLSSKYGFVSEPSTVWVWNALGGLDGISLPIGAREGAVTGPATNLAVTATTITRGAGSWITDGLAVGDYVTLASSENAANDGTWGPITALSATVLTVASASWTTNADDDTMTHQRAQTSYIKPSTDANVDRIVLEMTGVNGTTFHVVKEVLNTASSVTFGTLAEADALERGTFPLPWPDTTDGLPTHLLAPVAANVLFYRGRLWVFGQIVHTPGTVAVTNASASVVGTSTDWTADALTPTASGLQRSKRYLRVNRAALDPEATIGNLAVAATTITRLAGDWTAYGLAVGDYITIASAEDTANNGTYGPITAISATVITVASAAWTVNADDDALTVARATHPRYYEISAQTSATGLTLAEVYTGPTAAGATYSIFTLDNNVYYSEPDFPESWPSTAYIAGPAAGRIRALVGVQNGVLMYSLNTCEYYRFDADPATDGSRRQVSGERGAVNARVVVTSEERSYALDRHGIHVFEGRAARHLSRPVDSYVRRIAWTYEETFHACYYPRLNAIRWWVALDADTTPKHYLQLDLETGAWSTGQREVAVVASTLSLTADGVRAFVGDANGSTWFDDAGTTDGSDGVPNAKATGTPTTTVIDLDQTLPASPELVGVTVYHEVLGETRVVASHTTSQITVSVAFSRAPVAGERFQIGRILSKLRMRAVSPGGFMGRHRGLHLHVLYRPTADQRYMRVRFYRNFSDDADTWGDDAREDSAAWRGGLAPRDGADDTDALIDTSDTTGVARIPVPSGDGEHAAAVTEVELEVTESDVPVKVYGMALAALPSDAAV